VEISSLLRQMPTLVMHCRNDARVPFGRATGYRRNSRHPLPSARGRNHIMLEGEPALARFLDELRSFLASDIEH
jgi:hypothetical protein